MVKGWCIAVYRPSSSLYSNIGKSVTHTKACFPGSVNPSLRPISNLKLPSTLHTTGLRSAQSRHRSPFFAPIADPIAATVSSDKNLAMGDLTDPSSRKAIHANPLALKSFAISPSASICLRGIPAHPGAVIPRTLPPSATALSNT